MDYIIRDTFGKRYTVTLLDREQIEERLDSLDFCALAREVAGYVPCSACDIVVEMCLMSGDIMINYRMSNTYPIATHYLEVSRLSLCCGCFDVDEVLGDAQYEYLQVDGDMAWPERQAIFEAWQDYAEVVETWLAEALLDDFQRKCIGEQLDSIYTSPDPNAEQYAADVEFAAQAIVKR